VDWWSQEAVLNHVLLMAPLAGERRFGSPPPHYMACVWELPLLMFERDAWVATVMGGDGTIAPDVGRYLDRRFDGSI
jgi:hypothetical protein